MATSRQDIDDLFSMFHDFEIVQMKHENKVLTITMSTPWAELRDEKDFIIILELYGCDHVTCEYSEMNGVNNVTSDCKLISTLGLDIQSHKFYPPDIYEFFCEAHNNNVIADGQIKFNTNDFFLFDQEQNLLRLDKMKELATMWWRSIQKMWDDEANKNNP